MQKLLTCEELWEIVGKMLMRPQRRAHQDQETEMKLSEKREGRGSWQKGISENDKTEVFSQESSKRSAIYKSLTDCKQGQA